MIDNNKNIQPPKPQSTPPNVALPSQKPDQVTVILNAIQQLLNRMSIVEIKTIKNSANIDIINKTIELIEKNIAFNETRREKS